VELVKALGADAVIDYTKQDFSKAGRRYDIIFDTVGKSGYWRSLKSLKRGGAYVFSTSGLLSPTLGRLWAAITGAGNVPGGMARVGDGDLALLGSLVERRILRPVIDKSYPLEQIVEAHRYVDAGHKRGNVVISIDPDVS
jgi:NADPH:quinone reductase-like Zn-dependent oxidoreductase